MPRSADGEHPLQPEIPFLVRVQKRQDIAARGGIHMNRNIVAGPSIVILQRPVERLDVVVQTRPRHAFDRHDADRIFVAHRESQLRIERRLLERQGNRSHLDLPQLRELFPHDLETGRNHEIRLVVRLALRFALRAPAKPRGHAAQHAGFRRTDSQRPGFPFGLLGRVPQIGHDVDAAGGHYGHARVLGLVDIIDIDGLVHQLRSVVVHIGRYESGQIQARLGLRKGLVLDHLIGDLGRGRMHRNRLCRRRIPHFLGAEYRRFDRGPLFVYIAHTFNF